MYSPAPIKIKSFVSVYDPRKHGALKLFNYDHKKGEPRPGLTYRADRRNRKYKRAQYNQERISQYNQERI